MKKSFTIMELIVVIVLLGILAGIAVPKIMATSDDAKIVRLKEQVANIRIYIEDYAEDSLYKFSRRSYPLELSTTVFVKINDIIKCTNDKQQLCWEVPVSISSEPSQKQEYLYRLNKKTKVSFEYTPIIGSFKAVEDKFN